LVAFGAYHYVLQSLDFFAQGGLDHNHPI
jgi:hypothetical protein